MLPLLGPMGLSTRLLLGNDALKPKVNNQKTVKVQRPSSSREKKKKGKAAKKAKTVKVQ